MTDHATAATPLYLDHHATTPVDPRVTDAMVEVLRELPGNPSSAGHSFGRAAKAAVEQARAEVAAAVGAAPDEITFTSGATEALHLAIVGLAAAAQRPGAAVIGFSADHSATRAAIAATAAHGCAPHIVATGADGLPSLAALDAAADQAGAAGVLAIVATAVHNELGTIADLAALAARARAWGAALIVDAAQAPGRVALAVDADDLDLVALTAHKCYGPKGIGALWRRRRGRTWALEPLWRGGGQEGGLRAGTLPTHQIVGMGRAFAIAAAERERDSLRIAGLRDRLWAALEAGIEGIAWNGSRERRVAGNLNLRLPGVDAATLLVALPDIAISTGAACSSGVPEPSAALLALGLDRQQALASVRIGLGRPTTAAEVDHAAARLVAEVARQREASPWWAMRDDAALLAALGWKAPT